MDGSTSLLAQSVQAESQTDLGVALKKELPCITTASLGDSMTMGCLGGEYEGKRPVE